MRLPLLIAATLTAACGAAEDRRLDHDAAVDANDFCSSCGADEVCVQIFDGTCRELRLVCQPRHADCAGPVCDPACQQWECNDGRDPPFFYCSVAPCGGEVAGALHCYGP